MSSVSLQGTWEKHRIGRFAGKVEAPHQLSGNMLAMKRMMLKKQLPCQHTFAVVATM